MTEESRGEEQANVTAKSVRPSPKFLLLTVLVGIAAGFGGIFMMAVLRSVQHLALGYHIGKFSSAAERTSNIRLVLVLVVGGLVTGIVLYLLRNHGGTGGEPTRVVWEASGRLLFFRSYITGAISEISVGVGASLGREAAPQRSGAAAADALARRFGLSKDERIILIACGAGAGLAAVYNSPFAGALFCLEVYLGTFSISLAFPALLSSAVATWVAWIALPDHPAYVIPVLPKPTLSLMCFSLLIGPLVGFLSAIYVKLIAWASNHEPKKFLLVVEPAVVFGLLGVLAIKYPLLLGNGVDLAQFAFVGGAGLITLVVLAALKPIVTTACLRSGATGGLLTPTLSFGAIFGAFGGHLWNSYWPGSPMPIYAVIAAAAMLAAAAKAPLTGIVFIIELTHAVTADLAPILIAVAGATLVSYRFDLRSIYTARLGPLETKGAGPPQTL